MNIRGHIVFEEIEGGIWGIVDDHGRRFQPAEALPSAFRVKGLRVRAHVEPTGMASAAMWGHVVRVLEINRVDK